MKTHHELDNAFELVDPDTIVGLRRKLHQIPELNFDLPLTTALVARELDTIGIAWTDRYAPCSLVGTLGQGRHTVGIRADMDALPIQERNDVPYRSRHEGRMHACGHDAHTAMLLGALHVLKQIEDRLTVRVKFLFQPSEEGEQSGAEIMVKNGVMDDVDEIIGLHVENSLDAGCIGVCPGPSMAASNPTTITFTGRTAHATRPETGRDALAMAVKAYTGIQFMLAREFNPLSRHVCSVGSLHAGEAVNVVADRAVMKLSIRSFEAEVRDFILDRIRAIAEHAAADMGGEARVHVACKAHPIFNDEKIGRDVLAAAEAAVGAGRLVDMPPKLSSEDFSFYLLKKPGVLFRLGTRNREKGYVTLPHNDDFMIDEEALPAGSRVFVRFVTDRLKS